MTWCPNQGLTSIQGHGTTCHNPDKAGPLGRNSLELSFKTFMENILVKYHKWYEYLLLFSVCVCETPILICISYGLIINYCNLITM